MRFVLTGVVLLAILAGIVGCGGRDTEPVKVDNLFKERLQKGGRPLSPKNAK
jgi:hypothetical protein